MFQTFTGSSRRPRQVNLSGRSTTNPFANTGFGLGSQAAVLSAQQEREKRQRERDRLNATKTLQRLWRGHRSRRQVKERWREEWDKAETSAAPRESRQPPPYRSEDEALAQVRRMLHFIAVRNETDVLRFLLWWRRRRLLPVTQSKRSEDPWPLTYLRCQSVALSIIDHWMSANKDTAIRSELFQMLAAITDQIAALTARNSEHLYKTLAFYVRSIASNIIRPEPGEIETVVAILRSPLVPMSPESLRSYAAFACEFLTLPDLNRGDFQGQFIFPLADHVDHRRLSSALATVVSASNYAGYREMTDIKSRLALLGCFIYFHREAHRSQSNTASASHKDFVHAISSLLSSIADDVNLDERSDDEEQEMTTPMSPFTREQILSLVNQESIGNLLSGVRDTRGTANGAFGLDEEAKQLASYALTLLRFFPKRGDEIRMWLYLGSTSSSVSGQRIPAIKYFWQAARSSSVFDTISRDSRAAIKLLKAQNSTRQRWQPPDTVKAKQDMIQDEWRVVLIFFELYTFVLKLMDDEEFFSGAVAPGTKRDASTWAGYNALPLEEVKDLTTFLKNLGFTMYFNAVDIADTGERDGNIASLSSYFSTAPAPTPTVEETKPREINIAGLAGMSVDYVKGLVTGLLRMIYERDSRRKFLPKDHWLMTSRFDMDAFIPAVVQEEENRHRVQEEDDADVDQDDMDVDDGRTHLIGTGRDQRLRQIERLQRQQRKVSRKRYLQAVAPRLEILQNMPFFIPFETRVQIFREFVNLDQVKRRDGFVDPEAWRLSQIQDPFVRLSDNASLMRHHAKIRRKHEFEDAYDQFYDLKDGLKEPIQITFVDQFDTVEAGIDGGGVTKEFLTSVTNQAFSPSDGLNLFVENEKHLLYPNPAAWEEQREILRQIGLNERSPEFRAQMNDLLQRYEFLGRIIGKCLYEGILVDVNFAGFFLLKWALTGGTGSAPRESGYRANLNDLRDLDEALYQGLLQLKNYTGDVEDFALNFTITDTITMNHSIGTTRTVTRELRPDGANIPVTNKNRLVYISYVARHRLQIEPYRQTSAFLRGLSSMIQPSWLSMFNQSELQTLLGGTSSSIDVSDLRAHTQYGGVYVIGNDGLEHPTVQLFWRVMQTLTDEQRRAVLKFVTSTPRAPLLGFGSLNPKFSIRDSGSDETRLPSTSTCVNLLKLPRYSDERTLREKLLYAVQSGAGFDLS